MKPIPKCNAPGCRLWVWCEIPERGGMQVAASRRLSDKCWYHHHGKPVPEGTK